MISGYTKAISRTSSIQIRYSTQITSTLLNNQAYKSKNKIRYSRILNTLQLRRKKI